MRCRSACWLASSEEIDAASSASTPGESSLARAAAAVADERRSLQLAAHRAISAAPSARRASPASASRRAVASSAAIDVSASSMLRTSAARRSLPSAASVAAPRMPVRKSLAFFTKHVLR